MGTLGGFFGQLSVTSNVTAFAGSTIISGSGSFLFQIRSYGSKEHGLNACVIQMNKNIKTNFNFQLLRILRFFPSSKRF